MNKGQERRGEFVVSGGNTSELLETAEETLDQISIPIEMSIERAKSAAIGAGRDNSLSALRLDGCHESIGVVTLVGDDKASRLILGLCSRLIDVCNLPRRQDDAQRIAQRIDRDVEFCGQSASRPADFLTAGFFGRPQNADGRERWWNQ